MIENLSLKKIMESGLPVYLLGAVSKTGMKLIQMLKDNNIRPNAVWDEDFLKIKYSEEHKNLREDIFSSWGLCVEPVPVNFNVYPKGIIFVTAQERFQRNWLKYARERKGEHVIYDGFDITLFPVHYA